MNNSKLSGENSDAMHLAPTQDSYQDFYKIVRAVSSVKVSLGKGVDPGCDTAPSWSLVYTTTQHMIKEATFEEPRPLVSKGLFDLA